MNIVQLILDFYCGISNRISILELEGTNLCFDLVRGGDRVEDFLTDFGRCDRRTKGDQISRMV